MCKVNQVYLGVVLISSGLPWRAFFLALNVIFVCLVHKWGPSQEPYISPGALPAAHRGVAVFLTQPYVLHCKSWVAGCHPYNCTGIVCFFMFMGNMFNSQILLEAYAEMLSCVSEAVTDQSIPRGSQKKNQTTDNGYGDSGFPRHFSWYPLRKAVVGKGKWRRMGLYKEKKKELSISLYNMTSKNCINYYFKDPFCGFPQVLPAVEPWHLYIHAEFCPRKFKVSLPFPP